MALGEVDYGLVGLIGGLTGFVSFFNGLLASAVGRFYAVSVGSAKKTGNEVEGLEECRRWFNTALSIHSIVPVGLLLVGYPAGVWAIEHFLTIPSDRIGDCIWVWRFTCASCFIGMFNVPFGAMYTAKQEIAELTIYSFITTTLNAFFLYYMVSHPGIWMTKFAAWQFLLGAGPQLVIAIRAIIKYSECRIRFTYMWNGVYVFQVAKYAYARFLAEFSMMISSQARAILVNKYVGPTFNASVAIGTMVSGHAMTLAGSMSGAFYPAIANAAGEGDEKRVRDLCFVVCRLATILVLVFAIPLLLEVDVVLKLWLVNPPKWAGEICSAVLIYEILNRMTDGHWMAVLSIGRGVVYYSHRVCIAGLLFVVVTWILFAVGFGMWSLVVGIVLMGAVITFLRALLTRIVIGYSLRHWIKHVVAPIFLAATFSMLCGTMARIFIDEGFLRIVITTLFSEVALGGLLWGVVLEDGEKNWILVRIGNLLRIQ